MAKILDPDLLTYSVNSATNNLRIDTTNRTVELVEAGNYIAKDGVTGQCLFSKLKEIIKAEAALISVPLAVREMIHDESMELLADWKFKNASTLKGVRDCGIAYVNSAGVTTNEFACFVSLGDLPAGAADIATAIYFAQSSATDASTAAFTHVNTGTTFGVNELVEIYRDTDGNGIPDFDYRSYAKLFLRPAGYTYDEASNADIGYPTLTYKKYNFPLTSTVDAGVTVDDSTLDGAGYSTLTLTWYAVAQSFSLGANGPYNYHVVGLTAGKTHDQVYSWVQRQLRKASDVDAGGGNRAGNVTPALVYMDGTTLKTRYQSGIGGVHLDGIAAASYNFVKEYDDSNVMHGYPLSVAVVCEFDSYLQADPASYFWIFETADYGTPSAPVLQDALAADMTGAATSNTSFAFTHTVDVPITGVAMGLDGAKIAIATGTISAEGAKLVFVAGLERWYNDPA